jgi:DNA repair exonuclease SbcCD ATPase subunit
MNSTINFAEELDQRLANLHTAEADRYRALIIECVVGTVPDSETIGGILVRAGKTTADLKRHVGLVGERYKAAQDLARAEAEKAEVEELEMKRPELNARIDAAVIEAHKLVADASEPLKELEARIVELTQSWRTLEANAKRTLAQSYPLVQNELTELSREIANLESALDHVCSVVKGEWEVDESGLRADSPRRDESFLVALLQRYDGMLKNPTILNTSSIEAKRAQAQAELDRIRRASADRNELLPRLEAARQRYEAVKAKPMQWDFFAIK